MPRYYALDTAVKLCVWDPQAASTSNTDNYDGERTTANLAGGSLKNNGIAHTDKKGTSGPALGYIVDDLTEEYFEGHEGVGFVAPGMPFYLVKAGKELFASDVENAGQSLHSVNVTTLKAASSTVLVNATEDSRASSQPSAADSSLSSIDTEFSTPKGSFTAAQQDESSEASGNQMKSFPPNTLADSRQIQSFTLLNPESTPQFCATTYGMELLPSQ